MTPEGRGLRVDKLNILSHCSESCILVTVCPLPANFFFVTQLTGIMMMVITMTGLGGNIKSMVRP